GQNQKNTDHAKHDRRMREEKNFNDDQRDAQNKKSHYFPAGESGKVVTEKEKRETDRRDNSRHGRAGNFEFEIRAENSAEQQQWREGCDPKRELFKSRRSKRNNVSA